MASSSAPSPTVWLTNQSQDNAQQQQQQQRQVSLKPAGARQAPGNNDKKKTKWRQYRGFVWYSLFLILINIFIFVKENSNMSVFLSSMTSTQRFVSSALSSSSVEQQPQEQQGDGHGALLTDMEEKAKYGYDAAEIVHTFENTNVQVGDASFALPNRLVFTPVHNAYTTLETAVTFNGTGSYVYRHWYRPKEHDASMANVDNAVNYTQLPGDAAYLNLVIRYKAYHHTITETLPLLPFVCDLMRNNPNVHVLVTSIRSQQHELVQWWCPEVFAGHHRIHVMERSGHGDPWDGIQAPLVYVPHWDPVNLFGVVPPNILKSMGPREAAAVAAAHCILYLSSPGHTVENEEAVLEKLRHVASEMGGDARVQVYRSKLSWDDDRVVFGTARVIVSPHAEGLANMIFAPAEKTMVLELTGLERLQKELFEDPRPMFMCLAKAMGFSYFAVDVAEEKPFSGPITVQMESLDQALQQVRELW